MIPVMQTKLYSPQGIHSGNCLAACLASILEVPLWMVPCWEDMFGRNGEWRLRIDEWLERFFRLRMVRREGHDTDDIHGYYIASGQSARGVAHSCVYHAGHMRHDPHPSDAGIIAVDFTWHFEPVAMEGGRD